MSWRLSLLIAALVMAGQAAEAGTWTALHNTAPSGVNTMLLLSDGTVMAQAAGATSTWYKLTPNSAGSYINGTWTTLASMHDTRLYYSSDVMPNGKVIVAGGEYGSGGSTAEVYDPAANTWTYTPTPPVNGFSDSISDTIPNGNVLIAPVSPSSYGGTVIYNWASNTWSTGPTLYRGGYQDEASWVKLPDQSILTIDPFGQNSERYIPSSNQWINDSNVPVALYDSSLGELGAAFLLPSGKAFFLGSTGHTALYTPSGNTNPGTWVQGPDIPNGQGTPDAPAAMMVNGVILCAVGPAATYNGPTSFYEYNPSTNAFTQVSGPTGTTDGGAPYGDRMLDLPDGTVLYSNGGSQLYEYAPSGSALSAGRPVVTDVLQNSDGSYTLTGYQLTGISEGAAYGDDAQMGSDYPIVRLTASNGNVYYAKTYNWSSMAVMQGGTLQSTQFTTPSGLPSGSYQLQVVTNGIVSYSVPFTSSVFGWVASENQSATFTVPVDVAYGANGGYLYKYATSGTVTYSNTAFGGDPAYGIGKSGFDRPFTQCASEGGSYTFTVPVEAAYGANGNYYYNWGVSGTVTFSNAVWGDPDYGFAKAGYYMPYAQCAVENETVTFTSPTDIAYGANGLYVFQHAFTGTVTFNNATFGDPDPGVVKAGYYRPSH